MNTISQNKWVSFLFLVIAFALIYNPYTKFPFTFLVIIFFILLVSYLQDGNFKSLNFKKIGLKEVKIILISYLIIELVMDFLFQPLISLIFNEPADYLFYFLFLIIPIFQL